MDKKIAVVLTSFLVAASCTANPQNFAEEEKHEIETVNVQFIPLPFGQPEKSTFKNYRWGTLEGSEREEAKNASNALFIESLGIMTKVLEGVNINDFSLNDVAASIPKIEKQLDELRSTHDLFLVEQLIADKLQRKVFPNINTRSIYLNLGAKELNNDEIEILEFSTKLFIRNANPNAELMALNVHHLAGNVDSAILAKYARESIENAENWFGSERLCLDCVSKTNPVITLDGKMESVLSGIQYLEQFTGN